MIRHIATAALFLGVSASSSLAQSDKPLERVPANSIAAPGFRGVSIRTDRPWSLAARVKSGDNALSMPLRHNVIMRSTTEMKIGDTFGIIKMRSVPAGTIFYAMPTTTLIGGSHTTWCAPTFGNYPRVDCVTDPKLKLFGMKRGFYASLDDQNPLLPRRMPSEKDQSASLPEFVPVGRDIDFPGEMMLHYQLVGPKKNKMRVEVIVEATCDNCTRSRWDNTIEADLQADGSAAFELVAGSMLQFKPSETAGEYDVSLSGSYADWLAHTAAPAQPASVAATPPTTP